MQNRAGLLFLLLILAVAQPVTASAHDVSPFVTRTLRDIPLVPDVGIAVVRDGQAYTRNGGTAYYIASSTKAFTGLACAILAARGAIDLDAPITKYLPEVTLAPPLDAGRLTLRQFLTHTSGIANGAITFRTGYTGDVSTAEVLALLGSSTASTPSFHYTNLGYIVASLVIERVTGQPWQRALEDLVFKPLGMRHTTAYMSAAAKGRLATPYEIARDGSLEKATLLKNDQTMHGAGGIVTTPDDMVRWLEANIHEGRRGSRQLLPAAAFREAQKMQVAASTKGDFPAHGYGFGWYQSEFRGTPLLVHQGAFTGWSSLVSFMPEKKIGVVVLANTGSVAVPVLNLLARYLYDDALNTPGLESIYSQELTELAGEMLRQKSAMVAGVEARAKRPSMLQHAPAAYTGTYRNAQYGTLRIEQRGPELSATIARLTSPIEAYTQPESGRVELIPGSGEVLHFTFANGEKANAVTYDEAVFERVE
jgi:CubicO group peptidase (beta-lactamase class C family)